MLEGEHKASHRPELFDRLKAALEGGPRAFTYGELADEFGMTEAAVEGAVRRLRQRYRSLLRDQIAATLDDPSPDAIADEIRALFAALGPYRQNTATCAGLFGADSLSSLRSTQFSHGRYPMANANRCSNCGSELPPNAPKGLCPRCLARGRGLNSGAFSVARGGEPAATLSLKAGPGDTTTLARLAEAVGAVPHILLRHRPGDRARTCRQTRLDRDARSHPPRRAAPAPGGDCQRRHGPGGARDR